MIMMGLLGAMSAAVPPQGNRPSVLPPLSRPIDGARPGRPGAMQEMDDSCRLAGLERGRPVPKDWPGDRRDGGKVRIIHPGDVVTMDFIESRRNVHVDKNGNVTHVTCG